MANVRSKEIDICRLLVAPVMEKGAVARKVVLPPGKWLADDGKTYIGPATVEVVSPIEQMTSVLKVDMSFHCACAFLVQ